MSLLSFNIGIEIGQLLVLGLLVPLLNILFRYVVAERMGTIILSALVADTAWHWMLARFEVLRQFPWPTITAAGLASGLRWLMVVVAIAATVWLVALVTQRAAKPAEGESPEAGSR
jgi:Na+-transporting NADH:ubiquinone oxidoreductase subunit NqrE